MIFAANMLQLGSTKKMKNSGSPPQKTHSNPLQAGIFVSEQNRKQSRKTYLPSPAMFAKIIYETRESPFRGLG